MRSLKRATLAMVTLLMASQALGKPPKRPVETDVRMKVDTVLPMPEGHVVFLSDWAEERVVPISVGETEAISIALRLAQMPPSRPLTHDLFDEVIARLGAEVVAVHLRSTAEGLFMGTLTMHVKRGKDLVIDARASDSIAVALGNGSPIYMTRAALLQAGVMRSDLMIPDEEPTFELGNDVL